MLDVAPTELLMVAIVALLVIGPKDLPKAMRFVGHWVGKARGVARQFRSGFDAMVREAELAEMEKQWAEENARIMRMHPPTPSPSLPAPGTDPQGDTPAEAAPASPDLPPRPADDAMSEATSGDDSYSGRMAGSVSDSERPSNEDLPPVMTEQPALKADRGAAPATSPAPEEVDPNPDASGEAAPKARKPARKRTSKAGS